MHVGMFCSNYPPHLGGLEVMVSNLARGLGRRHRVTVVTSAWEGVAGVREEEGVTVHRLPTVHTTEGLGVPYPVFTGPGVRAALRATSSADVYHAHGALYANTLLAAAAARRRARPLVITEHVGFVEYRRAAINAVERAAWALVGGPMVRAAHTVVTINGRVREWLEARYPGVDVRYIGNGVDVEAFRPRSLAERRALRASFGLPAEGALVLFAGRQSEKKNLDDVLRLERRGYTLVVCGAARGLRGEGLIDLGIVPYASMPGLFGCVDAMVHASTGEGFPIAVQEAIATGVPLVLLWDEGYAEWLDRGVVAACDTMEEVGRTVDAVVADAAWRSRLAAAERAWAERRWSWEATVAAYEGVYADALREESRT
jgi:D-inositol-3-phosphate glycosyltransferase